MRKQSNYSLALDFHHNTKKIMEPQPFDPNVSYKIYPSSMTITLKKNCHKDAPKYSDHFLKTLLTRKSIRDFASQGIRLSDLSQLLTLSCGLRNDGNDYGYRTYASAGGRYPIEVYVAVFNSEELDKGIYHFNVLDNSLELIKMGECCNKVRKFYQNQSIVISQDYPCLILLSMVFNRTMEKYGERGYRFILLDAGHMSQNLYLVATYLGLGIVELGAGAGSDDDVGSLLGITDDENIFLSFALGYPKL